MLKLNPLTIFLACAFLASCTVKDETGTPTPSPVAVEPKPTLVKQWETEALLKVPESVLYDLDRKVLYVSNING